MEVDETKEFGAGSIKGEEPPGESE